MGQLVRAKLLLLHWFVRMGFSLLLDFRHSLGVEQIYDIIDTIQLHTFFIMIIHIVSYEYIICKVEYMPRCLKQLTSSYIF